MFITGSHIVLKSMVQYFFFYALKSRCKEVILFKGFVI